MKADSARPPPIFENLVAALAGLGNLSSNQAAQLVCEIMLETLKLTAINSRHTVRILLAKRCARLKLLRPIPLLMTGMKRFGIRMTLILSSLFVVAGSVLMATVVNTGLQAAIAFGVFVGFGVAMGGVLGNYYGMKTFAALIGLTVALNTAVGAIGPSLAGWLYDKGYGYQGVFYTIGVWCIVGSVILFMIKPPIRKTASEPAFSPQSR